MNQYFPNLQEVLYYDSIYALVLKEGNGSFGGKSAVAFLKKSELSMEEIRTVQYSQFDLEVDLRSNYERRDWRDK